MYSDEMKLRIPLRKIKADFLGTTKASIEVSMTNISKTITYEQAVSTFRQKVNDKFPLQLVEGRTSRRINQVTGRAQGRGRGRQGGRGGGRGGGR